MLLTDAAPQVIDGVTPGTWTLTLTPLTPGPAVRTQAVLVAPGATVQLAISFTDSVSRPALSAPIGPGASATLSVGGTDQLVVVGGSTYADAGGLQGLLAVNLLDAAGTETSGPVLADTLFQTAVAALDGKLFWFGGSDGTAHLGTGTVYDPVAATLSATAPLPNALALKGASAAALDGALYVTGGLLADEVTLNAAVMAYDPVADEWGTATLPALSPARTDMASAVVGGKWYLFGGALGATVFAGGANQLLAVAQSSVTAYTPGDSARWDARAPMPTARAGAGAVVVDGKVWVIGGAGLLGEPVAAVEVYDPAANTWEVRAPLRRARAFPAVGLLAGKITVAGGTDGADPLSSLPLDVVEVITP